MPIFPADTLRALGQSVLEAVGTPADLAQVVAEALVLANLVGHDSHGVMRLNQYVAMVARGRVQPAARAVVGTQAGATAQVDGARGWGQPAARLATHTVIELAQRQGIAATTIRRCNHIGRLGEYVELIAEAGLIGMALCNAEPSVAPYGGYKRLMGTNPLAWGIPRGADQAPIVIDFATAAVAEGKLRVARAKQEQIPFGIVVDSAGHASQQPEAFYNNGALLPFGGHKGYALSLMIELLGGALSGNGPSTATDYEGGNGSLLIAFVSDAFVPREQFLAHANELCATVKSSPPAAGFGEVLLPGEPERRTYEQRATAGITLPLQTWHDLHALATKLGIDLSSVEQHMRHDE